MTNLSKRISLRASHLSFMVKNERWGDPYIDTRDWSKYNERLVRRGEFYLSFDLLDKWDESLDTMNKGKPGRPFEYPMTFVTIQSP